MHNKTLFADPARQPAPQDRTYQSESNDIKRGLVRRLLQQQRTERERRDRFGRFGGR